MNEYELIIMKHIWLEMLVQNMETWHMRIPVRAFAFINTKTYPWVNGNKYRIFKGDRKMYGPVPHSNETNRLYLTFTVLN